jgi:hypothetical protein
MKVMVKGILKDDADMSKLGLKPVSSAHSNSLTYRARSLPYAAPRLRWS